MSWYAEALRVPFTGTKWPRPTPEKFNVSEGCPKTFGGNLVTYFLFTQPLNSKSFPFFILAPLCRTQLLTCGHYLSVFMNRDEQKELEDLLHLISHFKHLYSVLKKAGLNIL